MSGVFNCASRSESWAPSRNPTVTQLRSLNQVELKTASLAIQAACVPNTVRPEFRVSVNLKCAFGLQNKIPEL